MSRTSVSDRIDQSAKKAELHAAASTHVGRLAGAIKNYVIEDFDVDVVSVGAGAVNQAVKALARARGMLAERGLDLVVIPAFTETEIGGITRTAVRLIVRAVRAGSIQPEKS